MYVRNPELDGLGFPIGAVIAGVSALIGLFHHPKKPKLTKEQAKTAVQQIYLELLERDPWNPYDPGAVSYVDCLLRREDESLGPTRFGPGTCNVDDIRTNLLASSEYRDVQMKKAAKAYGPTESGAVTTSGLPSVAAGPLQSLTTMTVGGIPILYIAGGIVLLSLLRKR